MSSPLPVHVLLIEDDFAVRESIRFLLESWGYRVHVAHNGVRGIEEARALRPEAVVVDIGLPLVDGCEVARQVRSGRDDTLLIAVSGSVHPENQLRIKTAGFDLFLPKPVDPDILRQVLEPVHARESEPEAVADPA